jgi:PKD repeat protein
MKKFLPIVFGALLITGISFDKMYAQCANDNVLTAGNLTPPGLTLSTTQNYEFGQYVLASVVSGASYTVSTCSNSSFDTQITVYDNVTGSFIAYNDDFCGLRSSVTFTATNCNQVRILLDLFFCSSSTSSADVTMTMNTAGTGAPSLTPASDSSECNGGATTIGLPSNGSGGLPPYSYSWLPLTNLLTPNASQTAVSSVTANTTYTMTITDANGCTATDVVQVNVLPAPTVNLGADTTLCGTAFTLDAGNAGSSYLWNTAAGTQQITVTQSGNYSVTVQDPSGCTGNDNIVVTLNTPPSYSLGNDTSSCSSNVVLDAGSGYVSYAWSTGGTNQNETISSNDTVAVTVVDANGCVLTDTIEVTLSPAPSVNLGPNVTQCGGTVTLDAGNPGSLYFWSNNTSSQTTTVSTSGVYAVNVLTQAGCSGTDTVSVTINNQPVVNLGPDTSICLANVILDAGNPGSTYLWSTSATSQSVTVGSGTYSVTATDPSGCADSDTITVTTNVPPTVTATPGNVSICAGSPTTLTATGGVTYLWSNNQTGSSTTVSPTTSTAYYVTGTDANGCQASDVVIVTVLPATTALFTYTMSGVTANFTNQSTGAVTYSWNFGDSSPTSSLQNPSHVYTQNGVYTVTLTVTGPCGTSTYTQTITITQVGIVDADLANTLSIYPNPNTGVFTVSFEFNTAKDVRVDLVDVTGRIISSEERYGVTSYRHDMGSEDLANGVYFVRITTSEGTAVQKIAVQK